MPIQQEVVVTGKARGLEQIARDAERFANLLSRGGRAAKREMEGLKKELTSLTAKQIELTKELKGLDTGTQKYKDLNKALKQVNTEATRVESSISRLTRTMRQQDPMARGGFIQGLIQGGMPGGAGMFLQRGPGMRAQIAGMTMGRMARGIPGMFTGLAGFQQGLAGIPIVGGMAAGQLGTQMQLAQRALGYEQQRLQLAPFLAGPTLMGVRRAGARARAGTRPRAGTFEGRTFADIEERLARERAEGRFGRPEQFVGFTESEVQNLISKQEGRQRAIYEGQREDYIRRRATAGMRAEREARRQVFRPIEEAGFDIAGMTREQALQAVAPILQIGGGTAEALQEQGMTRAAFAAQRLGISPETIGAFQLAGRRGGLVGGRGRAGEAMAEAFGDAITIGLEGSELNQYLQQIASGIQTFQQTGIPVNSRSLSALGTVISAGSGITGARAVNISAGLQRAVQQLPTRGVTNEIDLMMLRTVGEFRGGGAGPLLEAFKRMEAGEVDPARMGKFIGEIARARGGGASGVLGVRGALQRRLGVQMGVAEAEELVRMAESGKFEELGARMEELKRAGPKTAADLEQMAIQMMETFGASTKRNAAIQNKQLQSGERMLKVMQDLEDASSNVNTAFSDIFENLKPITKDIARFSASFPAFVTAMEKMAVNADAGVFERLFGT